MATPSPGTAAAPPPSSPPLPPPPFQPVAGLLAWVIPGAGHLFLGHTRRAILIFAGITGLFVSGLFIGGIACIDRRENFFWFLGEALAGPATLGVNYAHQTYFKAYPADKVGLVYTTAELAALPRRSAYPNELPKTITRTLKDEQGRQVAATIPVFVPADPAKGEKPAPPYTKSLGRANELGTLFCTIAGFMNLICIVDASWRRRADRSERDGSKGAAA